MKSLKEQISEYEIPSKIVKTIVFSISLDPKYKFPLILRFTQYGIKGRYFGPIDSDNDDDRWMDFGNITFTIDELLNFGFKKQYIFDGMEALVKGLIPLSEKSNNWDMSITDLLNTLYNESKKNYSIKKVPIGIIIKNIKDSGKLVYWYNMKGDEILVDNNIEESDNKIKNMIIPDGYYYRLNLSFHTGMKVCQGGRVAFNCRLFKKEGRNLIENNGPKNGIIWFDNEYLERNGWREIYPKLTFKIVNRERFEFKIRIYVFHQLY